LFSRSPAAEAPEMTQTPTGCRVLDQEFLPIRAKLLEVAAALDRVDRSGGARAEETRVEQIRQAIATLLRPDDDRAEQIQLLFSRPYDDEWQEKLLAMSR
jgi:hypothetical protein